MRKKYIFGKKLYISILTSILVLLTTVATTFAWVGVFANSTFEEFNFNIKSSSLEEYGIEISLTGEENSFSNSISSIDIKRAILLNWGFTEQQIDQIGVNTLFSSLNMDQCTTVPVVNGNKLISLGDFTDMEGKTTKKLYQFDLYVSAIQYYDKGGTSDYNLDVYLEQGLFTGTTKSKLLINPFQYPVNFINPLTSTDLPFGIDPIIGSTIIKDTKVNSKSIARVGFEKYDVVDKFHPEQYTDSSLPTSAVIYTGDDYEYPTYDSENDVYEFGTILDDNLNVAVGYYNSTEYRYAVSGVKSISLLDNSADIYGGDVYNIRGVGKVTADKVFSSKTNQLINSSIVDEQIGVNQMMKIKVSFWFEGWDSDCFNVLAGSPVTISISMSIKPGEEF